MEADLTVSKLDEDKFLVVATDVMHNQVLSHMKDRLNSSQHVFVTDVTGLYAQISLQGPNSRALMQSLTSVDMDKLAFRSATDIDIGYARLWCMRITYVGELGYELYIPVEHAVHVYELIMEQGKNFALKHSGLRALGSLRLVSLIALSWVIIYITSPFLVNRHTQKSRCRKKDTEIMGMTWTILTLFLNAVWDLRAISRSPMVLSGKTEYWSKKE